MFTMNSSLIDAKKELNKLMSIREMIMKSTIEGITAGGNSRVGNASAKKTKVRRKSTHPITSKIINKIISKSSGELKQSTLKAFFVQVVNRRKPLDIARIYSANVHLIIWQLKSIVLDYYNGQERESKADKEVQWIKNLIERMEKALIS